LLDDRADYSSLLEKQSRFLVLDLPEAVCGPQPNYNDRTRRVVIKSITYNEGGATVEATFVLQEASHWERYTLRSNALGGKIFWGVSEILFYGFATI